MLALVQTRFLECSKRHLNEASQWMQVAEKYPTDLFGKQYAVRKANEHLEMVRFWQMAVRDIHFVPGTWAYKF